MRIYRTLKKNLTDIYGENEASAICFLLLEKHCGLAMTDVIMDKDEHLDSKTIAELEEIAERIAHGEPVQYVLGTADFHGHVFNVAPGVLIPRPETEELVEWICQDYSDTARRKPLHILDIGTGSGCIAISLACALNGSKVEAWDISEQALHIAERNAHAIGADVTFQKNNILAPFPDTMQKPSFSIIVSNPPYICEEERTDMERNVLEYEPEQALFVPDNDPLLFYRAIISKATKLLHADGTLYFEINRRFSQEIAKLMHISGFTDIEIRRDFMDNERMIKGTFKKGEE
ncbi:MAG: peptide chain release factor N(5)-glutamine methyltransferase [Bacteroides sp.]|nr:peptide chain release factor N(5)-glutamine methyltransferase [Roseburia sp.]MCM1347376.1 peptide chain release factor N(5)-glutamine methyltransferase [Bacteroides sp.]MCM1421861.1 peptide chain release factor N(5)-glutamine methyltransferase [Bacteroides sp.]